MTKILFGLLVLALVSCKTQSTSMNKAILLSSEEFKAQIVKDSTQIIDVRTQDEFKSGNILNSINIDFQESNFQNKVLKLDKSKSIYVYCQAGGRSAKAAEKLTELGFLNVYDLDGGYAAWKY